MDLTSDIDFRLTTTAEQRLGPSIYREFFGDEASEISGVNSSNILNTIKPIVQQFPELLPFLFVFRPVCSIGSGWRSFVIRVDSEGKFVELGCDTIVHIPVSLVDAIP